MKQILINASQREEVRLAIVEDNKLAELDIDLPSKNIKSNIYKGSISRVEPSLEAAFVNFGRTKHGFLPFKEIADDIFTPGKLRSARDCIEPGKEIVWQSQYLARKIQLSIVLMRVFSVLKPRK